MANKAELAKYLDKPKSKDKGEEASDTKGEAGQLDRVRKFEKLFRMGFGPDEMSVVDRLACLDELIRTVPEKK